MLSENQKAFIELMRKSEEHARRGFELLLKRQDFDTFFDALASKGFFAPDKNPTPTPADPDGTVRIPTWSALGYLLACAKWSDQHNDLVLADKVMTVVRVVTTLADGGPRDNYRTFGRFADILGAVPLDVISDYDIELVSIWLGARYDRDLVAHSLDRYALRRLLVSDQPEHWDQATRLVRHCLAVRWEARIKGQDEEPIPIVEPYQLKELIDHHATDLGKKAGAVSAPIFRDAVQEVFSKGGRAAWSHAFRPAVEDHKQNYSWRSAENSFVEGLRNVLLAWSTVEPDSAKPFVSDLLSSDVQMLRRIGVYLLDERWPLYGPDLYASVVSPKLFDAEYLHEVYNLLANRFEDLQAEQKKATIEAIQNIPQPDDEDGEAWLKRTQRRWLLAIKNTKYPLAAEWIAKLSSELGVGIPEHPDFSSYIETSSGPGPSVYEAQELVALAEKGVIVDKLNAFEPVRAWRSPTVEGLVQNLEQAVSAAPLSFLRVMPRFLNAKLPYQYGVLNAFKRLWEAPQDQQPSTFDWNAAWSALMTFLEELFKKDEAPLKKPLDQLDAGGLFYRPSWLISVSADMLRAGTRDDEHAYPATLLPRGWALLTTLSERAEALDEPDLNDPMSAAVNSTKGRTLEAIFGHALRACRLSDQGSGAHSDTWNQLCTLFDQELKATEQRNYEFLTLSGAYLSNLNYLSPEWLGEHLKQLFPVDRPKHFVSALGGLAYSAPTKPAYIMLRDAGIIDAALLSDLKGRESRDKLIERVMLGYLWDDENLESPRIRHFFEHNRVEDLERAAWFFWSVRGEKERMTEAQIEKIVSFLEKCVAWSQSQPTPPAKLLASLSTLAWALKDPVGKNRDLLLAVAPYAALQHNTHDFLKQLWRLAEHGPADVSDVLNKLIESYQPTFDYKNRMKLLVERLAQLGQRPVALAACEKLRELEGMPELFRKLRDAR